MGIPPRRPNTRAPNARTSIYQCFIYHRWMPHSPLHCVRVCSAQLQGPGPAQRYVYQHLCTCTRGWAAAVEGRAIGLNFVMPHHVYITKASGGELEGACARRRGANSSLNRDRLLL